MVDVKEAFVKIVANGLQLITADWSREYVKIKIQEMIFQVRFGTFNNQKAAFLTSVLLTTAKVFVKWGSTSYAVFWFPRHFQDKLYVPFFIITKVFTKRHINKKRLGLNPFLLFPEDIPWRSRTRFMKQCQEFKQK